MKTIEFPESNREFKKPYGMTDEECSSMSVYFDGKSNLSCWKMSWAERFSALFFGTVWLWSHGTEQQPVSLLVSKTAFEEDEHEKQ